MVFKRVLSSLLSAAVILTALPAAALAEEPPEAATEAAAEQIEAESETEVKSETKAGVEVGTYEMESSDGEKVSVTAFRYPCLIFYDNVRDLNVYFKEDPDGVPYIDLADWKDIMNTIHHDVSEIKDYMVGMEADGDTVTYTRENDYTAVFDFTEGTITFEDFDAFTHLAGNTGLLDNVSTNLKNENGGDVLLKRIKAGAYDRYGKEVVLNLKDYDIPVYRSEKEKLYLLPLQTLGDFFIALNSEINPYFNDRGVFLVKQKMMFLGDFVTPFGMTVYGTEEQREESKERRRKKYGKLGESPNGPISEELAWFNYRELCLVLDHLYGLKKQHGINSFDEFFDEIGYRSKLAGTDPGKADGALMDFIHFYLDDQHSSFVKQSYLSVSHDSFENRGPSVLQNEKDEERYRNARAAADHEIPCYEEVGNTAYVTFDLFNMVHTAGEYYNAESEITVPEKPDEFDSGTIALINYAHKQITREDSPIENVVLDLSLNNGGAIDSGAVTAAWFLGEAQFDMMNSMTGALSVGTFQVDINLDSSYDEKDTLGDRNLFCLISPVTFSCANTLASIFRSSHKVNLLGKTSGGGSCMVLPLSTAIGTSIQISSPNNMASIKNGTYSIIDSGVEPDYTIAKPENFYNREALTDYINNLF